MGFGKDCFWNELKAMESKRRKEIKKIKDTDKQLKVKTAEILQVWKEEYTEKFKNAEENQTGITEGTERNQQRKEEEIGKIN
ncbi:hypothetical protein ILUMI_18657 [Ignelater luminosus]|uniref:Uncharacterized protein n=1 Tax=Ignelater luminosus TaxID=2038154 RepID=A0A8K0G3X9_IGNLU|nr:hypothetical protein ILUMI_18657 [Ignelater luminosus]